MSSVLNEFMRSGRLSVTVITPPSTSVSISGIGSSRTEWIALDEGYSSSFGWNGFESSGPSVAEKMSNISSVVQMSPLANARASTVGML